MNGKLFPDDDPKPPLKYPKNGYAARPGTGPEGKRCADCTHCVRRRMPSGRKQFYKCELMKHLWTNGYGSDIGYRSPACKLFEEKDD